MKNIYKVSSVFLVLVVLSSALFYFYPSKKLDEVQVSNSPIECKDTTDVKCSKSPSLHDDLPDTTQDSLLGNADLTDENQQTENQQTENQSLQLESKVQLYDRSGSDKVVVALNKSKQVKQRSQARGVTNKVLIPAKR